MHDLASYIAMLYIHIITYAARYIVNLMLKLYLRHMQMCNDNLFYGHCMHMLKFERSVQLMNLSNYCK